MRNDYYVYGHYLNKNDTTPFYIGKGCRSRAYSKTGRNKQWHKMVSENGGYVVKFFKENMCEKDALNLEIKLIKKYGRKHIHTGVLVNETAGGETRTKEFVITPEMDAMIKKVTSELAEQYRFLRFI